MDATGTLLAPEDNAIPDPDGNLAAPIVDPEAAWEPVQPWEVVLLEKAIAGWTNVTPRRVAIYYYRYLLCKNLVIARYTALNRPNVWNDEKGAWVLLNLIRKHSTPPVMESISSVKGKIATMNDPELPFYEAGVNVTRKREEYLLLLDILELIVAY